jgi:hypothetical protein
VSPLWKSELTVRLGRDDCQVQLRPAWRRRPLACTPGTGSAAGALEQALAGQRAQGRGSLPRRARLLVPDERVYFTLLPADAPWHTAQQRATAHFHGLLARQDLVVQVAQMPGGQCWLAAAIEAADLDAWRQLLGSQGLGLASVELALLHDLRAIARHVADDVVVALLRDEGVTLVRVAGGAPVELSWERCDPQAQRCIEQRMLAFLKVGEVEKTDPLVMLCRSTEEHAAWQRLAKAHRWTTLTPRQSPAAAAAGAAA